MDELFTLTGTRGYAVEALLTGCATCSHCCAIVPLLSSGSDDTCVLLDLPCPRCGEEALVNDMNCE